MNVSLEGTKVGISVLVCGDPREFIKDDAGSSAPVFGCRRVAP